MEAVLNQQLSGLTLSPNLVTSWFVLPQPLLHTDELSAAVGSLPDADLLQSKSVADCSGIVTFILDKPTNYAAALSLSFNNNNKKNTWKKSLSHSQLPGLAFRPVLILWRIRPFWWELLIQSHLDSKTHWNNYRSEDKSIISFWSIYLKK